MSSNALTVLDEPFDDMPTSDRGIRRVGMTIVLVTFGIFGTWAAFAPLDNAVYGTGVVTVQDQPLMRSPPVCQTCEAIGAGSLLGAAGNW